MSTDASPEAVDSAGRNDGHDGNGGATGPSVEVTTP